MLRRCDLIVPNREYRTSGAMWHHMRSGSRSRARKYIKRRSTGKAVLGARIPIRSDFYVGQRIGGAAEFEICTPLPGRVVDGKHSADFGLVNNR